MAQPGIMAKTYRVPGLEEALYAAAPPKFWT
jgi:hypothetical protein